MSHYQVEDCLAGNGTPGILRKGKARRGRENYTLGRMLVAKEVKKVGESGALFSGEVGPRTDEDNEKCGLRETSVASPQETLGRCGESRESVGSV